MTPDAALAAAIEDHFATGRHGWSYGSCATAVVMSLPLGWCGHDPGLISDLSTEASGERLRADAAEAEIARLRVALIAARPWVNASTAPNSVMSDIDAALVEP
jgi:hypothetical protein